MKLHILKLHDDFQSPVYCGDKLFEFRLDDRNYQVGDIVAFGDPVTGQVISGWRPYEITYILTHEDFAKVPEGWVIFSIVRL